MNRLLSRNPAQYLVPVIIAAAMSYVSSRYLFVGSGLSLIPWGVIAISFGLVSKDKLLASQRGLIYGFSQSFIFLWIDKSGTITIAQFLALVVIITLLSLVAGGCGWAAASVGWLLRNKHV
ncbi:MAG TPA: hypothetical protein VLH38_05570 [Patescibacteria group bacterium]|nr:hypothetical protein [Patescibacteria group bacterium]